jgi:nicotinamidase-related amidase
MKAALLIVDVQRDLFEPEPRPAEADAVIERINSLADQARTAGAPVIFVQHEYRAERCVADTPGWELVPQLRVLAGDLKVRKTTPDSFLRTGLRDLLEQHYVEKLVICGFATEFCIDTTTRRAAAQGYEVVLAADAHTTHDKEHASAVQIRRHHNVTLADIGSFGPVISAIPTAEIRFD